MLGKRKHSTVFVEPASKNTWLHRAVINDDVQKLGDASQEDIFEFLNVPNRVGLTPIMYARHPSIVEVLFSKQMKWLIRQGGRSRHVMIELCRRGGKDVVKELLYQVVYALTSDAAIHQLTSLRSVEAHGETPISVAREVDDAGLLSFLQLSPATIYTKLMFDQQTDDDSMDVSDEGSCALPVKSCG